MAPIGDDTVQALQELVNKLESRVKQLEDKLQHASSGTAFSPTDGVRMILMGPPGAGACQQCLSRLGAINKVGAPAN
jgi:adenylate kinase